MEGAGAPAALVRPGEWAALVWSCAYFFCVLSAYYILRPVRDAMGLEGGVRDLPRLFLFTLGAMVVVNPLFSALVSRFPRRVFIPAAYRFFAVNLLIFYALFLALPEKSAGSLWAARTFFVWTSVFNLFVVSVFWGFMADLFTTEQSKRLFGMIAVGGTIGAMTGSLIASSAKGALGSLGLGDLHVMLVSVALLEVGLLCVRRLSRIAAERRMDPGGPTCLNCGYALAGLPSLVCPECGADNSPRRLEPEPSPQSRGLARDLVRGVRLLARSPYLLGIGGYVLFYALTSTLLWFSFNGAVSEAIAGRPERTQFFARVDLAVNVITLITQVLLTGRIMRTFGVRAALAALPAFTLIGFVVVWALSGQASGVGAMLWPLAAFQVSRRAVEFALAKPGRETLYTVVSRDEKYAAKSLIDTFIYRGADAIGAGVVAAVAGGALGIREGAVITLIAVGVSIVWGGLALWLAREQGRRGLRPGV